MFRACWWILHLAFWALRRLPSSAQARDKILADRAWKVLRFHFRRAGQIRSCDPYAAPMKLDVDRPAIAMQGIKRTAAVLTKHSLPDHLMSALLRKCDPSAKEQAAQQPEYRPLAKTPADGSTKSGTP